MLPLILGGLSAAGSLLSGLGASSAAKSQQRRQLAYDAAAREANANLSKEMLSDIPVRVARDAKVAGFNPVTWLNAGALGYYTNTYGLRTQSASQAINIPTAMQAVGGAISAGASAYGTQARFEAQLGQQYDQMAQQDRQFYDKLHAFGSAAQSHPGAARVSMGQSQLGGTDQPLYSAGSATSSKGLGGLTGAPSKFGTDWLMFGFKSEPTKDDISKSGVQTTQAFPWLKVDRAFPDANQVTQRYGEDLGELLSSGWNIANDSFFTVHGKSIPNYMRDEARKSGADINDFFTMDQGRNAKFLYEYFVPPKFREKIEAHDAFQGPKVGEGWVARGIPAY